MTRIQALGPRLIKGFNFRILDEFVCLNGPNFASTARLLQSRFVVVSVLLSDCIHKELLEHTS